MSDEFKCCNQHDHVSREDLYKEFKRHFTAPKDWCKLAKSIIDVTPPADVAPVIHGHWKNVKRVLNTEYRIVLDCRYIQKTPTFAVNVSTIYIIIYLSTKKVR